MGNSSSSSNVPVPTANIRDSKYFSQQQANNESVDVTSLIRSYTPRYCEYVENVAHVLAGTKYEFEGRFETTRTSSKARGEKKEGTVSDAFVVSGLLNVRGINKILNEMCKKGMLLKHLTIVMRLQVPISDAAANLLRAKRCQVDDSRTLVCKESEHRFCPKTFSFGRSLRVSLTLADLKTDSLAFAAPTREIASLIYKEHLLTQRAKETLLEECCICLERLFAPRNDIRNVHLKCGHSMHMECYTRMLAYTNSLDRRCPLCRRCMTRSSKH